MLTINNININNKKVLIRVDMNVPLKDGEVFDDNRIKASLPTINYCLEHNAKIILMTHLGRPKEGIFDDEFSIIPVAQKLSNILNIEVPVIKDALDNGIDFTNKKIVFLENVRFNIGEKKNDDELGKKYASLCDVYINDAFGTAHRAQASTYAVAKFAKEKASGFLLAKEVENLSKALYDEKHPMLAIVGGSKVSTKLVLLENLASKIDYLIVGGGIINTFLLAKGYNIGKSLVEESLIEDSKRIITSLENSNKELLLPVDVRTSKEFKETAIANIKDIDKVENDDYILDVGPKTSAKISEIIAKVKTILWNGPLGVFEFDNFSEGTRAMANDIASSSAFSIAGGGDTVYAITKFKVNNNIDYISTGGGAFLEFMEGKKLPALEILDK